MQFEEGKIIKTLEVDGQTVVLRFLKKEDAQGCMEYLNSLIDEKAQILLQEKKTLEDEKKWLESEINSNRLGSNISVAVEIDGRISGLCSISKGLVEHHATEHVASIGFGVHKNYRGMGIGQALASLAIDMAKRAWNIEMVRSSYYSKNSASAKLHEKLGFTEVGRIKNGIKLWDHYSDEVIVLKKL